MRNSILISLVIAFSSLLLIGCSTTASSDTDHSNMDHSNMDHSDMDHSDMDHSDMAKPDPDTKDQKEVKQQSFSDYIMQWHTKGIKGENVKVAVLDTGIDKDNKDLTYVKGVNFVGEDKKNFEDDNGHGTKISGIIGALENDYNLLGVSPSSQLYIAKVADKNGNVRIKELIKGINWAIKEDVDIINISLEFPEGTKNLHNVIKKAHQKGIIIVSSSGNINSPNDTKLSYPGAYSEVINVGMLDTGGKIYSKEFKEKKVNVYAPGEDIFSLYLNDKMTLDTGVSFATAYTTGYTALLINQHKNQSESYDFETLKNDLKKYLGPEK
jgi:subtilisin family serine protease